MKPFAVITGALIFGIVAGSLFAAAVAGRPSSAAQLGGPSMVMPGVPGAPGLVASGPGMPAQVAPATSKVIPAESAQRQSAPQDVALLPVPRVAAPLLPGAPRLITQEVETREITALMDDGVAYTYWTFDGTVPGPMLRVRQGDTVELTLKNAPDSKVAHSIDLHAVTGPGGGAKVTQIAPGESATFRFQALNPGVYVYHCATPMVPHHIASGMYGLIIVEPPEGLAPVDHEFYVMQGDFYLDGQRDEQGLHEFAMQDMQDEHPNYVVFNGSVGGLTGENALKAKVGETVRIFFGVGGPNLTSSFHVIGEIFDRVHPEGGSQVQTNVQTTLVPAGGATVVEFTVDYPGTYILVDHSLGRMTKGAVGMLEVEGPANTEIFEPLHAPDGSAAKSGH